MMSRRLPHRRSGSITSRPTDDEATGVTSLFVILIWYSPATASSGTVRLRLLTVASWFHILPSIEYSILTVVMPLLVQVMAWLLPGRHPSRLSVR